MQKILGLYTVQATQLWFSENQDEEEKKIQIQITIGYTYSRNRAYGNKLR